VVELLQLENVYNENVRHLSGGAQQRVAIGRALVRDPELILFDEPLSHLDGDQKVQLRAEIKRLQQTTGLTAILVTHDQTEAIAMSDRVAVMSDGVLQQCDAPQQLYDRPGNMFVAEFIGEPPMNLIPVSLWEQGGALSLEGGGWRFPLDGRNAEVVRLTAKADRLILGFRPEHVDLLSAVPVSSDQDNLVGRIAWTETRGDTVVCAIEPIEGETNGALDQSARSITMEIPQALARTVGDTVRLRLSPHRLNLFDRETGSNLLCGAGRKRELWTA
jgi:multiple sugar transport system ATP-binding protein